MVYNFQILTKKSEMLPHWALIAQLNNAVTEAYLDEVLDDMIAHQYRMVVVLDGEHCAGLAGIWVSTKIYSGKYLEMDNVVVDKDYRSKGIGTLLTNYITLDDNVFDIDFSCCIIGDGSNWMFLTIN